MSDLSPVLALPYILPAQAQKHVTHNEALRLLDLLVQPVVADRSLTLPPALPVEGERHIVAAGGLGAWAGHDGEIALLVDGGWQFVAPQSGWQAHVLAEATSVTYDGAAWVAPAETALQVAKLGVGTTPDATNRLAVTSPATLLSHAGAGHQLKLNKAAPGDTASLLFQTGFSGRAEMGLAGSDDFSVKVSADGAAWNTGLALDAATGKVTMPLGAVVTGSITGTAITQSTTDATAGRLLRVGDFGLGSAACPIITDFTVELAAGLYRYTESTVIGGPASLSYWGSAIVTRQQDGGASVLALRKSAGAAPKLWIGHRNGATGALAWVETYHQKSVLGTVSQSAGVPTGAILETGSNANGRYERRADGYMECWQTMTASGAAATSWTFPSVFVEAPVVTGNAIATVLSALCLDAAPSTTAATFSARDKTDARRADVVHLHAVGRWSTMV